MKKYFIFICMMLLILIIPNRVNAEQWYKGQYGCSYSDINKLRTLASSIKFEVKYLGNLRNNEYGIQITNISNNLNVYFNNTKLDTSKVFNDLYPSTYYTFVIKISEEHACRGLLEVTKKITIPDHNYYYDEELCKGAENLEICDPNYDSTKITNSEFKEQIEEYKNSVSEKQNNNKFIEFSKKYWYLYLISITFVVVIVFVIIKRKK